MADGTFCNNCGEPITGESSSGDVAARKPCPQCGSLARRFDVRTTVAATSSASAKLTVIPYPERLLDTAQRLVADGEFSIAVIVAHLACEISAERALSQAFAARGVQYLANFLKESRVNHNLANNNVRNLYNAVSGNEIHKQSFWSAFQHLNRQRNDAVHKSRIVTKVEAEASLRAATDLVVFLK